MNPFRPRLAVWMLVVGLSLPSVSLASSRSFQRREPNYRLPLQTERPSIRQDDHGSGVYGAPRSGGRRHLGIDLLAPVGARVVAAESGLARIGRKRNGMGRYLEVHHPDGWMTRYGHLQKIRVRDRQRVRRGQTIGTVGRTGNARRPVIQPHLHFEIWSPRKKSVDPWPLLARSAGRHD